MEIIKTRRDVEKPKTATLITGPELRSLMSQFIGMLGSSSRKLVRIATVRKKPDDSGELTRISTSGSEVKAWLCYKSTTTQFAFYIVSAARIVYLNANSNDLFMFAPQECQYIQNRFEIDLAGVYVSFDHVTQANNMFLCPPLGKILVRPGVSLPSGAQSTNMFAGCTALVGGSGTAYDASHTDGTYARVDDPPSAPGYFTAV